MRRTIGGLMPVGLLLGACSGQKPGTASKAVASNAAVPEIVVPAPASAVDPLRTVSRVIGKEDRRIAGGKKLCAVDFVYAGRDPEEVFREEPCADVTASMVDRAELERLNRWRRLEPFQQRFVEQMPGGRVLSIEGAFSASIYPIDEAGSSIEVEVAD